MNDLLGKAARIYSGVEDRVGNTRQRRAVLCSTSDTAADRSRPLQRGVTGGQGGEHTTWSVARSTEIVEIRKNKIKYRPN